MSAAAPPPVIALEGIRKSYGVGTPVEVEVLHGIDLTVEPGEFVALTGPSGSGKSTLLNIIGLLERPTAGMVAIDGERIATLDDSRITAIRGRKIGFVFQFHHLLPAFSALENVMMPAIVDRGVADAAAEKTAYELLGRVGLKGHEHKKPGALSGGMQQRVAIARALSLSPRLILADEPTGNLDTKTADEVFALMRDFNREARNACVIVTHDPRLALRCDRTVELVDGKMVSGFLASATVATVRDTGNVE